MVDRSSWFDDFGAAGSSCFALFDKLSPVKKEVEEKFAKVADD